MPAGQKNRASVRIGIIMENEIGWTADSKKPGHRAGLAWGLGGAAV
jgi:hypothetical protein